MFDSGLTYINLAFIAQSPASLAVWSLAPAAGCACGFCPAARALIAYSCSEIAEVCAEGILPLCQLVEMQSKTESIVFACVAGSYQLDHMQGCCAHSWRQKCTPSKGGCRWAAHVGLVFKKQSCVFNHMSCISRQVVPQLQQWATNQ